MKHVILAAMIAAATIAVPTVAAAQNACWPDRETMEETLVEKYEEKKMITSVTTKYASRGITGTEYWVNVETGTFTYVFVLGNGGFCVGDAGNTISFGPFEEDEPEGDPT